MAALLTNQFSLHYQPSQDEPLYLLRNRTSPERKYDTISDSVTYYNFLLIEQSNKIIRIEQKLVREFEQISEHFGGLGKEKFKLLFTRSLASLVNLYAEAFSAELTTDASIFYTFRKGNYTFHLSHYFLETPPEEAILSGYNKEEKLPGFSGTMEEIIYRIMIELNRIELS
jgi:hypothetical protein